MWKFMKQKSFKISTFGKEFFFPGLNFKYIYMINLYKKFSLIAVPAGTMIHCSAVLKGLEKG